MGSSYTIDTTSPYTVYCIENKLKQKRRCGQLETQHDCSGQLERS